LNYWSHPFFGDPLVSTATTNGKNKEFRDPIHGFITLTPWEQRIIDCPEYQRLRRIRQLALTDMVYPGANHTRFEHSFGVMHVATKMFERIRTVIEEFKPSEPSFTKDDLDKARVMVRLAALLHDVGHAPFSHAGEDVMPFVPGKKKRYDHENYSAAIIEHFFADVIENDKENVHGVTAKELCAFLKKNALPAQLLIWRELISGQMDADRSDYLLRDSHHVGVSYGHYDLHRIINTLTIGKHPDTESLIIAVENGGVQAVEGLIMARYMMFTQVYFHHTRRAYDHHITRVLKHVLADTSEGVDTFPLPDCEANLRKYLAWTDSRIWDAIDKGKAGPHGELIRLRRHDRVVAATPAVTTPREVLDLQNVVLPKVTELGGWLDMADKAWYKFDRANIFVSNERDPSAGTVDLPSRSPVVKGLDATFQTRIYVPLERRIEAQERLA
jgi:HD superfamily phosphohydrolase